MTNKKELSSIVKTSAGVYVIKDPAEINVEYSATCPECGKTMDILVTELNVNDVSCDCGANFKVIGKKPSAQPKTDKPQANAQTGANASEKNESSTERTEVIEKHKKDTRKGMIQWGTWPRKNSYILQKGLTTIGREDIDDPSDIQLKDEYVSRQSLTVEVSESKSGFLFRLFVKRAANPVYVNGYEHAEGTSVFLNDGDTIRLGKTKLRFCLESKK